MIKIGFLWKSSWKMVKTAFNVSKGSFWGFNILKITVLFWSVFDLAIFFGDFGVRFSAGLSKPYFTGPEERFEHKTFLWKKTLSSNSFREKNRIFQRLGKFLAWVLTLVFSCPVWHSDGTYINWKQNIVFSGFGAENIGFLAKRFCTFVKVACYVSGETFWGNLFLTPKM